MDKKPTPHKPNKIIDSILNDIAEGNKRGVFWVWLIVIGLVWVFLGTIYAGVATVGFLAYYIKKGRDKDGNTKGTRAEVQEGKQDS